MHPSSFPTVLSATNGHKLTSRRATFTIHDQPSILLDHSRQEELLSAARKGEGEPTPAYS